MWQSNDHRLSDRGVAKARKQLEAQERSLVVNHGVEPVRNWWIPKALPPTKIGKRGARPAMIDGGGFSPRLLFFAIPPAQGAHNFFASQQKSVDVVAKRSGNIFTFWGEQLGVGAFGLGAQYFSANRRLVACIT